MGAVECVTIRRNENAVTEPGLSCPATAWHLQSKRKAPADPGLFCLQCQPGVCAGPASWSAYGETVPFRLTPEYDW
jgi:hypothetical protein